MQLNLKSLYRGICKASTQLDDKYIHRTVVSLTRTVIRK